MKIDQIKVPPLLEPEADIPDLRVHRVPASDKNRPGQLFIHGNLHRAQDT